MYIKKEICAKCAGACCKQSGCMLSTRDIKSIDEIKELVLNKSIVIYSINYNCFILYIFKINDLEDILAISKSPEFKKIQLLRQYDTVYIVKTRSENQDCIEHVNNPNTVARQLASGKCVFLTSTGCEYQDFERPWGGLQLEPDVRGIEYCESHFNILDAALDWLKYHDALEQIIKK